MNNSKNKEPFKPKHDLIVMNTLSRKKEKFEPLNSGMVGMYVCGPTVYNEVHLGNCRTFFSFDLIYRYLLYLGYNVRYVRNITDVGHLVGDVDEGEEGKIEKQARLEQKEPMEIVQKYTNLFHDVMRQLNTLPPSIEPTATGHLIEQIEMVKDILANGYGYEMNGSVYFDTQKLLKEGKAIYKYGTISGKKQDDLLTETRDDLKNQNEKRHSSDFAIWVKAEDNHIMKWPSPWSLGFPGWHLECSVMSTKYLGNYFDIHGGGMDLQFPHHENEVAQNVGACGCQPVKYWLHTNMLVLNGKKMSKSTGNSILPDQLFTGKNNILSKAFSPMVVKFFMLQAHYASTLNITDEGLLAAEKGYQRLMEAFHILQNLEHDISEVITSDDAQINKMLDLAFQAMNDDFNSAAALAKLNIVIPKINSLKSGRMEMSNISKATLNKMKKVFHIFIFDIFGLLDESQQNNIEDGSDLLDEAMKVIIELRQEARSKKDWSTSDLIRDKLQQIGIQIKDGKDGTSWIKN
ncbi:cysteine--tRNA ligase [Aureispira]|nr:cysteine--tRNA ligase [Aureispira sp.]